MARAPRSLGNLAVKHMSAGTASEAREMPGSSRALRIAFMHWPLGDDKGFFKRLLAEAGRAHTVEVEPHEGPDLVFLSMMAERAALDTWRLANPDVPTILWFGENTRYPTRRHRAYDDYCLGKFDLVLGYKREHLGRDDYARLPYWIISRVAYFDEIGKPLEERFADSHALRTTTKKTRFASLIARHDISGLRGWMLRLLSHVGPVHCPSTAYNNVDPSEKLGEGWDEKRRYTASCLFSICPENSMGDGYTTEKPFDALLAGAWPFYCGEKPCEPDILRQECIIFADPHDVPTSVARLAECIDKPPPHLAQALVEGGERAIDDLLLRAIDRVKRVLGKIDAA
jgi:hypothetical protein